MTSVHAYAAFDARTPLRPHTIERREPSSNDVSIEILFCGVCHSDLHTVRSEWSATTYPCVPGHEIVGRVTSVGSAVSRFRAGELAGVGCLVSSCQACSSCHDGFEQYCTGGITWTYNSDDPFGPGPVTYGGYSSAIVVNEAFCLRIPESLDPAGTAPLLCAGITTYSPLRQWRAGPGTKVGVVGLGGLGHMAVKLAHAMGAEVFAITSSPAKAAEATRLGADTCVVSTNRAAMKPLGTSLDLIINTVSAPHNLDHYTRLLKRDATMVLVGEPPHDTPHPAPTVGRLIKQRRRIAGSLIGGIAETQEMLDFCSAHGIVADIEQIPMLSVNTAYERMLAGDVRYRFVLQLTDDS